MKHVWTAFPSLFFLYLNVYLTEHLRKILSLICKAVKKENRFSIHSSLPRWGQQQMLSQIKTRNSFPVSGGDSRNSSSWPSLAALQVQQPSTWDHSGRCERGMQASQAAQPAVAQHHPLTILKPQILDFTCNILSALNSKDYKCT